VDPGQDNVGWCFQPSRKGWILSSDSWTHHYNCTIRNQTAELPAREASVFPSVIIAVFKVFFILKYIKKIFFLYFKNYFLNQYIKTIQNI
jgi:hypothetical protein